MLSKKEAAEKVGYKGEERPMQRMVTRDLGNNISVDPNFDLSFDEINKTYDESGAEGIH